MVATHVSDTLRRQMISEAAYFIAEHRGFSGGDPLADWLQAEAEVDTSLGDPQGAIDRLEERLTAIEGRTKAT